MKEVHLYLINALSESQQWSLADQLKPALTDCWGRWNTRYLSTRPTPADYTAITGFLAHVTSPVAVLCMTADIGVQGMEAILCGSAMPGYKGLYVHNLIDEDMQYINAIVDKHPSLEFLRLYGRDSLTDCLSCENNYTVRHLNIWNIDTDSNWIIDCVQHFPSLDTLGICMCTLESEEEWEEVIRHLLNCDKLKYLSLRDCDIRAEHVQILAELMHAGNLSWLDLSGNNINDEGVRILAEGLGNAECRLEGLCIQQNDISPEGHGVLCASLQGYRHMTTLVLDLSQLKDPCCALQILKSYSALKELDVCVKSLSMGSALSAALDNNATLQVLAVQFEDQPPHAACFTKTTVSKTLQSLALIGSFSDDDVQELTSMLQHSSLHLFQLTSNGKISGPIIKNLIDSTCLQLLDLCKCTLDMDAWQQTAQAVCHSSTLRTVGFGMAIFLEELVQYYPSDGHLKALYCGNIATDKLACLAQAMKDKMQHLDIFYGVDENFLSLTKGYRWSSIPDDRRIQIYHSAFYE